MSEATETEATYRVMVFTWGGWKKSKYVGTLEEMEAEVPALKEQFGNARLELESKGTSACDPADYPSSEAV